MRTYKIKPEYLDFWGAGLSEKSIITSEDVKRFAKEKNMTLAETIPQLIPLEHSARISVNGGHSFIDPAKAYPEIYRSGFRYNDFMDKSLYNMIYAEMEVDIEDLGQFFDYVLLLYYLKESPDDVIVG